jgi:putative membrane protein
MLAEMRTDAHFAEVVERAVARVEEHTDAEIVIVASPRSGHYRDVALRVGIAVSALLLAVALFAPFEVAPRWVGVDLVLGLLGGTWVGGRIPTLIRLLTSRQRRRGQVMSAAAAAFHEDQVHATRGRTGLLIYLSAAEQDVVVIPDHGLAGRIPQAEWNAISWDARSLDGFVAGLDAVGAILARYVPALAGDNPDELSNAPRIRR